MVNLSKWRFDGESLWGVCQGHEKLADGTYVHTTQVEKIELCDEGLDVFTHSGTHYRCKTEEISLDFLKETKMCLEKKEVNTAFLDNAAELVKKIEEEKFAEVKKLLKENDLYLEFLGVNLNHAYFKKNGVLIPLTVACHVGMFQDSYLIREPGVVDVRYFDRWCGIDFYHVSDGINNIHFKYVGEMPFKITGIGDELEFTRDDTEIKTIKPVNCKEGLITPDCVNGKSALLLPADTLNENGRIFEFSWEHLSDDTKEILKFHLENGQKLKVTIKEGNIGCEEVQEFCSIDGYLLLYKSNDNYVMVFEQDNETVLSTDDFEYICSFIEKYRVYIE